MLPKPGHIIGVVAIIVGAVATFHNPINENLRFLIIFFSAMTLGLVLFAAASADLREEYDHLGDPIEHGQ